MVPVPSLDKLNNLILASNEEVANNGRGNGEWLY